MRSTFSCDITYSPSQAAAFRTSLRSPRQIVICASSSNAGARWRIAESRGRPTPCGERVRPLLSHPDLVQLGLDVSGNDERGDTGEEACKEQAEDDPPVQRRLSEHGLLGALESLHAVVERDERRNDHEDARKY